MEHSTKPPFRDFRPMDLDAMDVLRRRMEYATWAATVQPPVTDAEAQAAANADDDTHGHAQALAGFRAGRGIAADVDEDALCRAARVRRTSRNEPLVEAWRHVLAADLYATTTHTEETS